ncbi:hypothetical protein [Paeniglutamicibacter gangotriensis]|uniref:hypothetical protein n=1 Tax=Paeniglutamicibacter gangotriensis TaxID=254787 RepID=UPI00165EF7BF|nr:hypothetical protein [Paeniglutamicibacter gangotriensis]
MRALEIAPEPERGHGPSWEAMLTGRREFAGRVLGGLWAGHEVLVVSYGKARRRREPRPEDFSFSADYWLVDWDEGGKGDGDADFSVETIDEASVHYDAMFIAVQQAGSEQYGSASVYRTGARTRCLFLPLSLGLLGDDVLCNGLRFRDECRQGDTIQGNPPFSA